MPQLAVEGLGKQYTRDTWALRELSFALEPGVVGLLGANGAGKSTLMNILATITSPTVGRVCWEGADIARDPGRLRLALGYLPQDFGIYPHLNAVEFMEYMAAVKGLDHRAAKRRIEELLQLVNLSGVARRPLGGYSGGMRQRVGIAQALLGDPRLLIVDEPTAGLDPEERARFRELLAELAGDRLVILSSHIVSDIEAAATAVLILRRGRLVAHASPERLIQAVAGRVWRVSARSEDIPQLRATHVVSSAVRRADGVEVRIIADCAPTTNAEPAAATLEDAYLAVAQGENVQCIGGILAQETQATPGPLLDGARR